MLFDSLITIHFSQVYKNSYFNLTFAGPRKIINTEPRGQAGQTRCQNGKIGRSKPKGDILVLFKNPKNKTFVDL